METVKPYSVLGTVQVLVHTSLESTGGDIHSIAKQVSMASYLLRDSPALYNVSLNILATAYHHHITNKVVDSVLGPALHEAEEIISSLLDHAPQTWSHRILQWCVDVTTKTVRNHYVEEQLPWLQHPKLTAIVKFLNTCTNYMIISGSCEECVKVVMKECLEHAPNLNWLLKHILSLQPNSLIPSFLEQVLYLPLNPLSPAFIAVGQTLEYLGHINKGIVGPSVLGVVEKTVRGDFRRGGGWGRQIETLLRLAPLCDGLLTYIAGECLSMVTAEKIKDIVTATTSSRDGSHDSHMTSDDDDGEVRSDDESGGQTSGGMSNDRSSIERAVVDVIRVLRKDTVAEAISQLINTYSCLRDFSQSQEEAMEEGEIVHVSLVTVVQESCHSILTQLLQSLHIAAMIHLTLGTHDGTSCEAELAVGLQCGINDWSVMMLQPHIDSKCREWLCSAVANVCVCTAELQAAKALATMLLHCQNPQHLNYMMRVYNEVSVRYTQLAESVILISCDDMKQDNIKCTLFCINLWRIILSNNNNIDQQIRSNFTTALKVCLLPLSVLLCELSEGVHVEGVWRLLEVISVIKHLETSKGDYSIHCEIISNLLSVFFNYIIHLQCGRKEVDIMMVEMCIGRCCILLAEWGGLENRECLRMFLLTSLISKTISLDVGEHVIEVKGWRKNVLPSNKSQSFTTVMASKDLNQPITSQSGDISMATDHILSLLEMVARGNGDLIISILLDIVAPHLPSDSSPWLPGEGPRSTSLEWSLIVKQQFDKHPFLWQLLIFSTHCGCGFAQCEPVVCSLLLVLTQHWFSVRYSSCSVGKELISSQLLIEALSIARWLPTPLSYCGELLQSVTSNDLYLILNSISDFIKINLEDLRRGSLVKLKDTACKDILKGVLVRNIHKLGHLYAHYIIS